MLIRELFEQQSQLNELFNQTYTWAWIYNGGERRVAEFETDAGQSVKVSFGVAEKGILIDFSRDGSQSTTGDGDAYKIFATVFDVIEDYINDVNPEVLIFSAEKKSGTRMMSRINLYTRMVKKFANNAGYDFEIIEDGIQARYKLTRRDSGIAEGVGRITKQNQTADVGADAVKKQAKKFGNTVDRDGYPPLLNKKYSKNTTPNRAWNLGLTESGYSDFEIALIEGGHDLEEWRRDMKQKNIREQAAEYLGKDLNTDLTRGEKRKISAKARKIKTSEKKNNRRKIQ